MDMDWCFGSRSRTDNSLCHRRQSKQCACAADRHYCHHGCHDNCSGSDQSARSVRSRVRRTTVISCTADLAGGDAADDKGSSCFPATARYRQTAGNNDRAKAD